MIEGTISRESILDKEYCSKNEAAFFLGISTDRVTKLAKRGDINARAVGKRGHGYVREFQTKSLVNYEKTKTHKEKQKTPSSLLKQYKSTTDFRPAGALRLKEAYQIFIDRTFRPVTYDTFEGWCNKHKDSNACIYTVTCGIKGGLPTVYILQEELDNFIEFYNNAYPKDDANKGYNFDNQQTLNLEYLSDSDFDKLIECLPDSAIDKLADRVAQRNRATLNEVRF